MSTQKNFCTQEFKYLSTSKTKQRWCSDFVSRATGGFSASPRDHSRSWIKLGIEMPRRCHELRLVFSIDMHWHIYALTPRSSFQAFPSVMGRHHWLFMGSPILVKSHWSQVVRRNKPNLALETQHGHHDWCLAVSCNCEVIGHLDKSLSFTNLKLTNWDGFPSPIIFLVGHRSDRNFFGAWLMWCQIHNPGNHAALSSVIWGFP